MKTQANPTRVSGHFMVAKGTDPENMQVVVPWFDNLILNAGLNRLGSGPAATHVYVGGGSTAPSVTETALVTPIASTTATEVTTGINTGGGYTWQRYRYRFAAGAAAGTLAEVGVGWGSGLFSRALILDTEGDPTTIPVLSTEFLDVTYELRVYPPAADVNAVVNISGVNYTTVLRAGLFNSANWASQLLTGASSAGKSGMIGSAYSAGALGAIDTAPGGSQIAQTTGAQLVNGTYSNNSYEWEYTLSFGLTDGTADFHALMAVTPLGTYKMSFTPPLPKRNTNILNLTIKGSWARR